MRKIVLILMAVCCLLMCAGAAAEPLTFDTIGASCEIPDSFILLLPDNLQLHQEWLTNHDTSEEDLLAEWTERGVLAQAWTADGDTCIEITAVQDEDAEQYFDVDQQDAAMRSTYRAGYLKNSNAWKDLGYTIQSAEWKKTAQYGRFLMLKYKRTVDGQTYRGYARRTIRNGYTITVDVKVFDRGLKNADLKVIDNLMNTWRFDKVLSKPIDVVSEVRFTSEPPLETNTGKFTIEGTCDAGLRLVAVAMRMSSPDPLLYEATANAKGKFSINVKLPQEGVWLISLTVMNGDSEVGDHVFEPTTYSKLLLPVNFDHPLPEEVIDGDKLVISGTTMKQTSIQCIVSGAVNFNKQIRTNNSGKFSFSIDTAAEGEYDIVLTFTKKGLDIRRFTSVATRTVTAEDLIARAKTSAIKPAYATLVKKLGGYTGKIMRYDLYVTSVTQVGSEWIMFMAMNQNKDGSYKNIVVVTTPNEPNLSIDSKHTVYGTCTGSYSVENEEGNTIYPCFSLISME